MAASRSRAAGRCGMCGVAVCALALLAPLASCGAQGRTPLSATALRSTPVSTLVSTQTPPAAPGATATHGASSPTAAATPTTGSSGPYAFPLIPPGGVLPSEAACASLVQLSSWEPRSDNATANHTVPTSAQLAGVAPWNDSIGVDPQADALRQQITGQYTGTTDEILQWVACKWGIPVDVARAEAVVESYWHQNQLGDWTSNQAFCPPGTWNGAGCYSSYGILQVKWYYFQGTWPMIQQDTAFDAEYMYGVIRTCYEGWTTYLNQDQPLPGYPSYHAGDLWGCIGRWFSGGWYTQGAVDYIATVKSTLAQQTWKQAGF